MTYRPSRYETEQITEAIELMEPEGRDALTEVITEALYDLWCDSDWNQCYDVAETLVDQFDPELA